MKIDNDCMLFFLFKYAITVVHSDLNCQYAADRVVVDSVQCSSYANNFSIDQCIMHKNGILFMCCVSSSFVFSEGIVRSLT